MRRRRQWILVILLAIPRLATGGSNSWTGGTPAGAAASPEKPALVAAASSDPYRVYAAFGPALYRSTDGGRTWELVASFDSITALELARASSSTLYVGARMRPGTPAGVFRSEDGGATWTQTLGEDSEIVVSGFAASASAVFAFANGSVNENDAVFRSADGGRTWEQAANLNDPGHLFNTEVIAELILDAARPSTLYAVGSDIEVYYYTAYPLFRRSEDGGATWEDVKTGLGFGNGQAAVVDGADPQRILLGIADHASVSILRSWDGGVSWEVAQRGLPAGTDVTDLVTDPVDATIVYAATRSGIYVTRDAGDSWLQTLHDTPVSRLSLGAGGGPLYAGTPLGVFAFEPREGAVDIAADTGTAHVLTWQLGRLSVRTIPADGEPTSTPAEGPFAAWTAVAISDGTDGRSRVLWQNGDGRAALEIVGALGREAVFRYPAIAQWSAVDVAAARDGSAAILWTGAGGEASIASVDATGVAVMGPWYGPYAGWSAVAVAGGSDDSAWVLWRCTDGRTALSRHRLGALETAERFAANPGWAAEDLAVGADGRPRLLRIHTDGRAEVATVASDGRLTDAQIHANTGFAPLRIAAGPDGLTRLLWGSADGKDSVTLLKPDNTPAHVLAAATFTAAFSAALGETSMLTLSDPCSAGIFGRSCPSPQDASATFVQTGSSITGRLTTQCEGTFELQGTLGAGTLLRFDIVRGDGTTVSLTGSAGPHTMIDESSRDLCDYWGYDTTVTLQLSR